jgi:FdhD protein
MNTSEATFPVTKVAADHVEERHDLLAVEEPLEIRITYGAPEHREQKNISVTMRTPGADEQLALGFLFTEGIITSIQDVENVDSGDNVIDIQLTASTTVNINSLQRNFYTTSSCGVCGKASIDAVMTKVPGVIDTSLSITAQALLKGQKEMIRQQELFTNTGGIHASALVSRDGSIKMIREDVGRHNALDKVIGAMLQSDGLPIKDHFIFLSGRASFELMQKAAMAGIQIVAAVGAPSSLAVEFASKCGITLLGFVRGDRFNIYCGSERIRM